MLWHLYLRKGTVYIPTVAKTEAGYYIDIDPVEVIAVTDAEALYHAIQRIIGNGNPKIATPTRATFPKPVVLNYAKLTSWAAFEKGSECWEIKEKDNIYKIQKMHHGEPKGWIINPTGVESLPPGGGIDSVAQRILNLVQSSLDSSQKNKSLPDLE